VAKVKAAFFMIPKKIASGLTAAKSEKIKKQRVKEQSKKG
jgi:hypothetical protein